MGAAAVPHDDGAWVLTPEETPLVGEVERSRVGRHYLLVCGPFGPFTRRLAARLRSAGARCSRVILNGGDLHDWGLKAAVPYFGRREAFGGWLEEVIVRHGVTDIITYGDAHPYCVAAAKVARRHGLNVHVLEQGYFRPFWITLERNGVNGHSGLPRDAQAFLREAASTPEPQEVWLPPLTPPAVGKLMLYHAILLLLTPAFPHFHPPYQYPILRQGVGHARRYLAQRLFRRRYDRALAAALDTEGPLFLGVLQRPGDSQICVHSDFSSVAAFIHHVVDSFAAHAPADARLLFKSHPLDHGLEDHARTVAAAAAARGVSDRVFFSDVGDLTEVIPAAAGAVTVNSTAGLLAIERGLPTVVLGRAIYDLPGLTHQGGLESFWTAPTSPDRELYLAFRKVVIARSQISGAYAIAKGIEMAAPEVARRLLEA